MLQVKLVTPIYYVTKFQGIFISQKMTLWPDDNQRPLTCVAIAAGNNTSPGQVYVAGHERHQYTYTL